MRQHQEEYQAFLGENVDEYLDSMQQAGTWGDELTLVRFLQQPCMSWQILDKPSSAGPCAAWMRVTAQLACI